MEVVVEYSGRVKTAGLIVAVVCSGLILTGCDDNSDTEQTPEVIPYATQPQFYDLANVYQNGLIQSEVMCLQAGGKVEHSTHQAQKHMAQWTHDDPELMVQALNSTVEVYNQMYAELGEGPDGYPESLDTVDENTNMCAWNNAIPAVDGA